MAEIAKKYGLSFAISQNHRVLANDYPLGFALDQKGCDVDYVITSRMNTEILDPIEKCSASADPIMLQATFPKLKQELEERFPCAVVQSTPYIIDITERGCDKVKGCTELFQAASLSFADAAAIGDGDSDALLLAQSAYSATLENGSALCKQNADILVEHAENNGCITFFQALMQINQGQ